MITFPATDGTTLTWHSSRTGEPLVCLPGGPMQASAYLGDLGGLSAHRALGRLDLRGTGESSVPADPATYRADRQVDDVEALREHLGLDRFDLLGHSAGSALALLYAAAHPGRVRRLVLVCPSPRPVGLEVTDADRREVAETRRDEPWFPAAFAAFERIWDGDFSDANWAAIAPFSHGRWDEERQAFAARESGQINADGAAGYYAPGGAEPDATRAALAGLTAPVLLVAGGFDVGLPPRCAAEYAGLFPAAELAVVPGGGHFPWLDDPGGFVRVVGEFLR